MLHVLRPVNREKNKYRFIGECYTHGLIDGGFEKAAVGRSKDG